MIYHFADYALDVERQELRRGDELVDVEPQVLDLLQYLIRNRERVVSKDDLIEHVWHGRIVSESTLTSRITAARQAIGDSGDQQRLIRTVARKGIRFVGDVRDDKSSPTEDGAINTVPLSPGVTVLRLPDKPSIAVLPFTNISGDTEQEYFADGITEDIITDLSKIAGLLVIARNSSFTYKGKNADIRTIGRELGVRSVLEGSVRRASNRVRITAQLVNVENGAHLWAERYDRDLTDIFAVQDDVTRSIVDALKVKLTPGEAARVADIPTNSIEAHDLFLRGRELMFGRKWNREIFDKVVSLMTRAIELDPNYAEPYAGLGMAHNNDFHNRLTGSPDAIDVAEHFATLAIEKGPTVPIAHWIAGAVAIWKKDLERGKRETEAALALNPNYALAYGTRGNAELYSGHPFAAIPFYERAIHLDPAYAQQYLHFVGASYLVAGKYEMAVDSFRERIRLAPETDLSRGLLVSALGHLGEIDEAQRIWAELKKINPKYSFAGHLARLPFSNPADADRIKGGFAKAMSECTSRCPLWARSEYFWWRT